MTRAEILNRLTQIDMARLNDRGDHDLNPGMAPEPPFRSAAVLVPLVERADGITVLLTRRSEHLADHPGQVSFPGGRIESDDLHPEAAALREAHEEVGLAPDRVEVIGRLATYRTRTGFEITPVVGLVTPPFEITPDPTEVAEVFEVPLAFLLDPANAQRRSREWRGMERFFWVFPYSGYYIWGATAGMLVNLAQILRR
ncbi:MAG: CoA pyrophosphatase [Alphaproteobacteria bacterium]|nr:CoA pyrophosphatase [Alphaproteobacteria bacterium]